MNEPLRQDFLASRPNLPANNAATFLENRVRIPGQEAPVFINRLNRVDSLQVAQEQQKLSNELWQKANAERDTLLNLMEQVRAQLDKKDPAASHLSRLDTKNCTWDQVLGEVNGLASRWSSLPKRKSKMLYLDRLGRNSESFKAWLELLPTGDYGSSICGVFAIALNAASQYVKVEDAIIDALAQIPEAVRDTREYLKLYAQTKDHLLEERTFDLYFSILKALTHIMRFFADRSLSKFTGSFLKQSGYQKELLSSLEDVKLKVSKVKDESDRCMQRRMADMQRSLVEIGQDTTQGLQILRALYNQLIVQEPVITSHLLSNMTVQPSNTNIEHAEQPSIGVTQVLKQANTLLKWLRFDVATVSSDIQLTLSQGYAANESSQAKAAKLIECTALKSFILNITTSGPLLINGNEDMSEVEGTSPVGLVSARIALASETTPQLFLLSFFCTEHRPYGSSPGPPISSVMMASLVGQLLTTLMERLGSIDLDFLNEMQPDKIKALNLTTLCVLFSKLAKKVPEDSVLLCLIDGIDVYDTAAVRDDIHVILRRLARQIQKRDHIVFKLISTCRGRAGAFASHFPSIIDMEESVEPDDSSQWRIANTTVLERQCEN